MIEGDRSPRPDLLAAARAVNDASDEAARAGAAAALVEARWPAVAPRRGPPPSGPSSAPLPGISAGFTAAAGAADDFVDRRRATNQAAGGAGRCAGRPRDDDPRGALADLDRAERSLDSVGLGGATSGAAVLVEDHRRLVAAARRIATASLAGDADAVARAAHLYARAADEAHRADMALAIAIAESGSTLAASPLQLLADALDAATEQRRALAEILTAP